MFLALALGAFSFGQTTPGLQDFSVALGAAGFIYDTIDRVQCTIALCIFIICCIIQEPEINSQCSKGLKPGKFESDIVFDDIHFSYPARPDVPVSTKSLAIHRVTLSLNTDSSGPEIFIDMRLIYTE